MPRRSIWKGSFFDAFLLRMKKKRDLLLNRKIWSRRSSISPEFVDCSVRIYNEKLLFVVRSLKERLVINLESLLLHGNEDLREKRLDQPGKRMIDQQMRWAIEKMTRGIGLALVFERQERAVTLTRIPILLSSIPFLVYLLENSFSWQQGPGRPV